MPQIILGPNQNKRVDGSVKRAAYAFLEKLATNDALPGLHIEPIIGSADPRVRTGRVNDFYRAVLFKVQGHADEAHYVYLGVFPHDDAIAFAKQAQLKVNPVNGIAELVMADEPPAATASQPTTATPALQAQAEPAPSTTPATSPAAEAQPILAAHGIDHDALLELGIEATLASRALAATSEDALIDVVENAPQWQALALIDLAAGKSIAEVRDELELEQVSLAETEASDDELLDGLRHEAAKLQFAFIEGNDELRRAIEDEDFGAWRVFLHPEQRRYATRTYNGPFRLSGGAGTGKTVVLLHRARMLAHANPQARIVLTTYNRVLADSLKVDLRRLDSAVPIADRLGDPGVYVAGVDSLVHSVVQASGAAVETALTDVLGSRSPSIDRRTPAALWLDAAGEVADLPDELRSAAFFQAEYSMVVLPARITQRDDYLRARRPGRGVALNRARRQVVWQVIEAYRARASIEGSIDYGELAAVAAAVLEATGPRVDHLLVDEGQDLEPAKWQFLRALVARGVNDLFIAEDSHQRIYGQRVVLGRYGIEIVGRARRLTLNYRTTAQNLRYALAVLDGGEYVDMEDMAETEQPYRSARIGPDPQLMATSSLGEGLEKTAHLVRGWLEAGAAPETIGILVRDLRRAQEVVHGLDEVGVATRLIDGNRAPSAGKPLVMTMHRAKGMEFSRVVLFDVSRDAMPIESALDRLTEGDREDAVLRERSLLYVAASRAREELVVLWRGQPSELLPTSEVLETAVL